MNRPLQMRMRGRRGLRGLGYPVLPDSFVTAAGMSESFSPQTPDATVISLLQSQGQQLPPNLATAWAAAQTTPVTTPAAPAAVTPSGAPVSTQTGATVTVSNINNIAPGVYLCTMSDGSQRYCDASGAAINYTPPATPATTPAAGSQPTSVVAPAVTTTPLTPPIGTGIVALTPSGEAINSTTGQPTTAPVTPVSTDTLSSITTWLEGSLIAGIPNWVLLGGAAAAWLLFSDNNSGGRRR